MRRSSVDRPRIPLSNVLKERTETPNPSDLELGLIPIISKIGFDAGKIELRQTGKTRTKMILIRPGDLVLSGINAAKGTIAICKEKIPISATIHYSSYKPNPKKIDTLFLWYFLRSEVFRDILRENVPGGIKTELKPKRFLPIRVPLPILEEQRRIVTRIEKLTTRIEDAKNLRRRAMEKLEELLGARVDRIVTDLAKTYKLQSLINVVESDRGISYGVVLTGTPHEHGVPTLRAGNLQKFRVLLNNVKCIDPEVEQKYRRTRLHGNEVLLRIRGGFGEVAVCPPEVVGGNVSREIAVIPFTDRVLPKYGMYLLSAPCNQTRMKAHLRGTSYVGINLKDVRMLPIPVPPLPEQRRIVAYLGRLQSQLGELRKYQAETQRELDALTQSILSKAFRGEL